MSGLFLLTLSIKVPPLDENDATVGTPPNCGVFEYKTAPTVIAPAAFACPTIVPLPEPETCSIEPSPLKIIYLNFTLLPPDLTIKRFVSVFSFTVKGNTSIGSPPILFLLKPNKVEPSLLAK